MDCSTDCCMNFVSTDSDYTDSGCIGSGCIGSGCTDSGCTDSGCMGSDHNHSVHMSCCLLSYP